MIKVCTSEEFMASDVTGLKMRPLWYPTMVAESYLEATKDGEIERAPDAVTTIDGDLTWFNNTQGDVVISVLVHRAPRTIVTTDPCTVVIHDAWNWAVGAAAQADYPSVMQDSFGGRLQVNRPSVAPEELAYGRYFLDSDDCQTWVHVGLVPSQQILHFRYLAAVQTPGVWVAPTEIEPRYEAYARWTRLQAWSHPIGSL